MSDQIKFADPIQSDDPTQCLFYHLMNVPGHGEVGGQWDLRPCIKEYLGNYDFSQKRALDVGAAAGFLTFAMEKQGAQVVSFDMENGAQWDVVPQKHVRENPEARMKKNMEAHRKLKNAYWFTHARLRSKAQAYYGNIYALPKTLGRFDVAVMGMIISHLRDPLLAIQGVAQLCDTLIITNQVYEHKDPIAVFMPTPENQHDHIWWIFSEPCIKQILAVMGFEVVRTVTSEPVCHFYGKTKKERCIAFVAQRMK